MLNGSFEAPHGSQDVTEKTPTRESTPPLHVELKPSVSVAHSSHDSRTCLAGYTSSYRRKARRLVERNPSPREYSKLRANRRFITESRSVTYPQARGEAHHAYLGLWDPLLFPAIRYDDLSTPPLLPASIPLSTIPLAGHGHDQCFLVL